MFPAQCVVPNTIGLGQPLTIIPNSTPLFSNPLEDPRQRERQAELESYKQKLKEAKEDAENVRQYLRLANDEISRLQSLCEGDGGEPEVRRLRAKLESSEAEVSRLQSARAADQSELEALRVALQGYQEEQQEEREVIVLEPEAVEPPPYFGMELSDGVKRQDGASELYGAIKVVRAEGPAVEAGLQPMDFIMAVDGREVSTLSDFHRVARGLAAGESVEVQFNRDGTPMVTDVVPWPSSSSRQRDRDRDRDRDGGR